MAKEINIIPGATRFHIAEQSEIGPWHCACGAGIIMRQAMLIDVKELRGLEHRLCQRPACKAGWPKGESK